jgi:hypothetical protein
MSVLWVPGYWRLWAARTVSQWGDIAQFTALVLLLFHLIGSGLGVSGVVVAEIVPVLLLARWSPLLCGYKTDIPYLSNGWRWSAARMLSGRCATPVVGPGGSAISRKSRGSHRVGLNLESGVGRCCGGAMLVRRASRGSGVLQGSGGRWSKALWRREGVGQRTQPVSSLSRMRLGPSMRPLLSGIMSPSS